ncbi:hypothetical protein AMAG_19632 [Allomyces macrogynus ATCC 38327]|uniref:Uncharacterized protein n=1 Tax=Allomyces macrogynus (strain ATCC 38327) TaxID=578462 RepID=A0A0L0SYN0_ALLM3|nr:hypothetical protein AMAG_19632 [Allomyces macrogynus ATCC 38327]|eukprot:KNE67495.1 hypothetical protein AMAG_19632 [Allomyces macrogynus ATCC 38327]
MGGAASVSARAARAQIIRAMEQYADRHASIPDARVHCAVRHAPVGAKVQAVITAPEVLVSIRDRAPPVPAMPVAVPTPAPPVTLPPTPSPARPAPAALQDFVPGVSHLVQGSRRPSPTSPTPSHPGPATPPPTPVHATSAVLQAQAPVVPNVSHLVQTSRRPSAPLLLLFGAGPSHALRSDRRPSTPSPLFGAAGRFAGGKDRRPSEATAARIAAGLAMRAEPSAGARSAPPDTLMMTVGAEPARALVVHLDPWGAAAPAALPAVDDEEDHGEVISTVSSAAATLMSPQR